MSELNIVDLIENNPITRLSNTYQGKLLNKIREKFTDNEQQLFLASFYSYLNYNAKTDFVIDLDKIWKWLDFCKKHNAKSMLEKQFKVDIDYKIFAPDASASKIGRGGHNKETIMLTVYAFKNFCLKAGTKKADQIHEYYLKLEETLQEVCNEETNELKSQFDKQLENILTTSQKEKELLREKTIIEQFSNNVQCVYYGIIDDVSSENEPLIKFGNSNCLRDRIEVHKKTFSNFRLMNAFKVDNKTQIENAIKNHASLRKYRRTITINKVNYTELLSMKDLTFEELDKIIKNIIISIEYSPENYKKIVEANLLLEEENKKLKAENVRLINSCLKNSKTTISVKSMTGSQEIDYNNVTNSMKRISKNYSDGLYYIGNKTYKSCFGTRDEVWKEDAYKTSGGLMKGDLMLNKHQKIVSKRKFIAEKQSNRLARKPKVSSAPPSSD